MIFDIGAHKGNTASGFRVAFPGAAIHCFEPVRATFEILRANTAGRAGIECHQLAIGESNGQSRIYLAGGDSSGNTLISPQASMESEVVEVRTVDGFASDNGIGRVDLLKTDTEGFEMEVLRGARNMLSENRIPFVLVEAGFHPGDNRHVLFDRLREYMLPMGYSVFGIYDQQLEWSGEKRLRFANVCFCNEAAFSPISRGEREAGRERHLTVGNRE